MTDRVDLIDLSQARTRAKELLTAGGATGLADAQRQVAADLGYAGWPALVRDTERLDPVRADDVPWERVRRVTVVCFDGDDVVLYRDQGRWTTPAGDLERGEDAWDDTVHRLTLQRMGFRRQGTHPLALDRGRRHVAFWADGNRYDGARPHRTDAEWWVGPPAEAAALLTGQGDGTLARLVAAAADDRRTMTYEQHAADLRRTLVGSYLRADSPQGGSGFGGSDDDWREARGPLADALDADRESVTFLDHCCANGHLAVSMVAWGAERGVRVEPWGVDVAPELVERARADHPDLADRFLVGDALTWRHPDGLRFDLVHMLYDVVPADRWAALTDHLLAEVVAPGGRLLVSNYSHHPDDEPAAFVPRLGHDVAGRTAVRTFRGRPRGHASVWIQT